MKRKLILVLGALLIPLMVYAADTKITGFTADTSPTADDLIPTVNAPGTSPANRKVTVGDILKGVNWTDAVLVPGTGINWVNIQDMAAYSINWPVTFLNGGTNAGATTYWRGDGTWVTPDGTGDITAVGDCTTGACFASSGTGTNILAPLGSLGMTGVGGSNNEGINWDFESVSNQVKVSSPTSATAINWVDLELIAASISAPTVSGGGTLTTISGSSTGTGSMTISSAGIVNFLGAGGINWVALADQVKATNVNWSDVQELNGSGRGGTVYTKNFNASFASPAEGVQLLWQNRNGMTLTLNKISGNATSISTATLIAATGNDNGQVNWTDSNLIETLNMENLVDSESMKDGVNWYSVDQAAIGTINWTTVPDLGWVGINWTSVSPTSATVNWRGTLSGAGN